MSYMEYLYQHIDLLMYLRYHPKWYKILYYNPEYFPMFLNEAKASLKIRGYDKLEEFKNKFNMMYSLASLMNK